MVKGSGMRIKVGADSVHIHAKANHQTKRLGFPVEGGEDEAHLLFSGACRFGKPSGLFPISQANRRRQRQLGPRFRRCCAAVKFPFTRVSSGMPSGQAPAWTNSSISSIWTPHRDATGDHATSRSA